MKIHEYTNGEKRAHEKDNQVPTSELVDLQGSPAWNQKFDGEANLIFNNSEPATVYYTLDGSRPTFDSEVYSASGTREPPAILTFSSETVVNWFAVDSAGNISRNYDPDNLNNVQYYSTEIRFR